MASCQCVARRVRWNFGKSKKKREPGAGYCAWGCFRHFWLAVPKRTDRTGFAAFELARALASAIHLQCGNESFLRDVDLAELPHLLLAFLLLLQKFSFARDVAAVALCGDVLAQGADGF